MREGNRTMFCTYCGKQISETQKFCPVCGEKNLGYKAKKKEDLETIVRKAIEGDALAQEKIYTLTYKQAYAVAMQIVKNEQDAMDILQESYISAFVNLDKLANPEKLKSWFNCIVANRCRDWLKKKKPQLFTDMSSDDESGDYEDYLENKDETFLPEESMDYAETKRLMREILERLPEDQKLCVLMYYYEELSVAEIANALECSEGTIKSRLNYARKKIKLDVEELERKGTKLYSIAPLPFIIWMLRAGETSVTMPEGFQAQVSVGMKAGNLHNKPDVKVKKNRVKPETSFGKEVAKGAAKGVAKNTAKKIVTKVVAGAVAVSVLGIGGYQIIKKNNEQKALQQAQLEEQIRLEEEQARLEEERLKKERQLNELLENADYEYLANVATYLPDFDAEKGLTDDQLYDIYKTALWYSIQNRTYDSSDYNYYDAWEYETSCRQIIPESELITANKTTGSGVFEKTALDKFMQVIGESTKLEDLNLSYINGENYEVQSSHAIPVDSRCDFVRSVVDFEQEELIIHYQLSIYPEGYEPMLDPLEEKVHKRGQTMVVKLKDNDLGYQIESLEDGYRDITMPVEQIAKDINRNPSDIVDAILEQDEFAETKEWTDTYQTSAYFLRAEVDQEGEKVLVHYLSVDYFNEYGDFEEEDEENLTRYKNFQRGTLTIIPKKCTLGYAIEDNALEPWDDNYAQEMRSMEVSAASTLETLNSDATYTGEYMNNYGIVIEYWERQCEETIKEVKANNPTYSEAVQSDWEEYQEYIDAEAEAELKRWGGNAQGVGATNAQTLVHDYTKARVYYYVGNFLMDEKMEVLEAK